MKRKTILPPRIRKFRDFLNKKLPRKFCQRHRKVVDHVGSEVDDGQVGDVVELRRQRDQPVAVRAQHPKPDARTNLAWQ